MNPSIAAVLHAQLFMSGAFGAFGVRGGAALIALVQTRE
jgi:hypothetical protein